MALAVVGMLLGLVVLTGGAEGLVRGAASMARRFGLSPLLIGLTVVAFGTSMPELVVSVGAALRGSPAISLGNVIGSNISNIGLILGAAALVRPLGVQAQIVRYDMPILVGTSLVLVVMMWNDWLGRLEGLILVAALIAYFVFSIQMAKRARRAVKEEFDEGVPAQQALWMDIVFLIGGLGLLVGGAELLVNGAVTIAQRLGVSELVIGLTIVAVGTSLPELATSVTAAYRHEGDIAVGNVVGSCILNIVGILGPTVLIHPFEAGGLNALDQFAFIGLTIAVLPLMRSQSELSRREGVLLLLAYAGYVLVRVLS